MSRRSYTVLDVLSPSAAHAAHPRGSSHAIAQRWLTAGLGILVAQTGWGRDHDRRCSREAGFDHHLVKPAELSQIQEILDSPQRSEGSQNGKTPRSSNHPGPSGLLDRGRPVEPGSLCLGGVIIPAPAPWGERRTSLLLQNILAPRDHGTGVNSRGSGASGSLGGVHPGRPARRAASLSAVGQFRITGDEASRLLISLPADGNVADARARLRAKLVAQFRPIDLARPSELPLDLEYDEIVALLRVFEAWENAKERALDKGSDG